LATAELLAEWLYREIKDCVWHSEDWVNKNRWDVKWRREHLGGIELL